MIRLLMILLLVLPSLAVFAQQPVTGAPKLLAYTDQYGANHPQAYWNVMEFRASRAEALVYFAIWGWHDKAAHDAGKPPIAKKTYTLAGAEAQASMAYPIDGLGAMPPAGTPMEGLLATFLWNRAFQILDVPAPTPEDPAAKKSFFDGAADAP